MGALPMERNESEGVLGEYRSYAERVLAHLPSDGSRLTWEELSRRTGLSGQQCQIGADRLNWTSSVEADLWSVRLDNREDAEESLGAEDSAWWAGFADTVVDALPADGADVSLGELMRASGLSFTQCRAGIERLIGDNAVELRGEFVGLRTSPEEARIGLAEFPPEFETNPMLSSRWSDPSSQLDVTAALERLTDATAAEHGASVESSQSVLDQSFFDDLHLLAVTPDPASPPADRAFEAISLFCERIEAAARLEMNPFPRSKFDAWIKSEGGGFGELWRWCGPYKGVKLLVTLGWGGGSASVALTKWLAPDDESDRFSDFLGSPRVMARERLTRLSEHLEREYEISLDLVFSRNYGQRRLIERGIEWQEWQQDPARQATVRAVLWAGIDEGRVLHRIEERAQDPIRQVEELGRLLPGAVGKRQLELASDGEAVGLLDAIADANGAMRQQWRRRAAQGIDELLLAVAEGLSDLLREFRDREKKRSDVLGNPCPAPSADASAVDIAEAIRRRALSDHPRLENYRPENATAGLEVLPSPGRERASVGWVGTGKALPRVELERSRDALVVEFVLDDQEKAGGKVPPSAYRRALAFNADGANGAGLVELLAADPHLALLPGKSATSGTIEVRSADDLRRLFIWRKGEPRLRWAYPVDASTDELRGPATLISSLFAQAISDDPPELVVPEFPGKTFNTFISFAGTSGADVAEHLRSQLVAEGVGTVWHMSDHQNAGSAISQNNRTGVEHSKSIVLLLHSTYWKSDYCCEEFRIAAEQRLPVIPLLLVDPGTSDGDALQRAEEDAKAAEKRFRAKVVRARLKHLFRHVVLPVHAPITEAGLDPTIVRSVADRIRSA